MTKGLANDGHAQDGRMDGMKRIAQTAGIAVCLAIGLFASQVHAGGTIEIEEHKWISVGLGLRTSYSAIEDGAPNRSSYSNKFALENLRLYVNGQIHKYIKVEFNTECTNCFSLAEFETTTPQNHAGTSNGDIIVLDAIGKFEFSPYFNIWGGRMLVASDRAELDGPFFQNTFDFNKTPFYPQDFGNFAAGRFGRDDGVNFWGAMTPDKRLTYIAGVFDGLDGQANQSDNPLFAARITYNLLNVEQNPGYYTSSTYYGTQGDILTVAFAIQHETAGAGTQANPGDFTGFSVDTLFEKVFPNNGVLTFEGEYKHFNAHLNAAALADSSCFCLFDGNAWTATGLYLFPEKVGMGQFQPYVRYTKNDPTHSSDRYEVEGGVNYVIDGFNARVSLFYQYGDIATKGRSWVPGVTGEEVSAFKLALQLQL